MSSWLRQRDEELIAQLSALQERVTKLEYEREANTFRVGPFLLGMHWRDDTRPTLSVKQVVQLILDHLKLELVETPRIPSSINLVKKPK